MNTGDSTNTPDGAGTIADIEYYNRLHGGMNRYGVEPAVNPYSYSPVYFYADEVNGARPAVNEQRFRQH